MATVPALLKRVKPINYPESDGKPLGETGIHAEVIISLMEVLWRHYTNSPNLAVLCNMFLYYIEGDPKRNVCPDVFMTLGVPANRHRRTFKVWEERKCPDLVIEVTSRKTRTEDTEQKFELYRDVLKVREYFLFDPLAEYLEPSLTGYRLVRGRYKPIPEENGRLPSGILGLHLERGGLDLRLYDPLTARWLPTAVELEIMYRASKTAERKARAARRKEEEGRRLAEAELERLRRENQALRKRLGPGS